MRKQLVISGLLTLSLGGCSKNPIGPTTLDPMQTWAANHAHEICVTVPPYGYGVLMPLERYAWAMEHGFTLAPLSYCNPAE